VLERPGESDARQIGEQEPTASPAAEDDAVHHSQADEPGSEQQGAPEGR
jgi:hypothetical protein